LTYGSKERAALLLATSFKEDSKGSRATRGYCLYNSKFQMTVTLLGFTFMYIMMGEILFWYIRLWFN